MCDWCDNNLSQGTKGSDLTKASIFARTIKSLTTCLGYSLDKDCEFVLL